MRLRFFNTFEPGAPLYRDLLPYLSVRGHEAEVMISRARYRAAARPTLPGIRFREMPAPRTMNGVSLAQKLAAHAGYVLGAAAQSLILPAPDLNVFITQPPLFSAWGVALGALRRQPFALIVMDLYPWVAFAAGVLASSGAPGRTAVKVMTTALRRARRVIVIGRCMAERVQALGVGQDRIRIIPNWLSPEDVRPLPPGDNPLLRRHGLDGKFVVMYSGNHGEGHFFDDILAVARELRDRSDVAFVFVGRGVRRKEVLRARDTHRLQNLICFDFQAYDSLSESLGMGDVHFISLRDGFEGLMVPSKAYGVLAAGRPIIYQGHGSGEIARIVHEEQIGRVVPQGDTTGLRQAILEARQGGMWWAQAGATARRLAETTYHPDHAMALYLEALLEAC